MPPASGLEAIEVVVSVTAGEIRSWTVHDGHAPRAAVRRVVRTRSLGVQEHPDWQAALRRRGIDDFDARADRPVAGGLVRRRRTRTAAASAAASRTCASRTTRQRLRPPDRGRHRVRRPRRAARCSRSSTSAWCRCPPERGSYLPDDVGPLRDRPQAARDRPARRPELRRRREPRALAALVVPRRLRPVRGARAAHRRATTTATACARSCTARRSPRWSCPTATPAPMHGWKNAFDAGEWGLGRMANSLKLGCDCLGVIHYFDAVLADRAGRPVHGRARDLHARGGLRDPLEAPRPARRHRRGPALAPPRRELHRHRRQLRVRLLLVLLPRRHHPARGEAHRHRVADGRRRRATDPSSPNVDRARARRAAPPAPLLRPPRPRRRRHRRTRSTRSRPSRCRPGPDNPWGNAFRADGDAARHRARRATRRRTRRRAARGGS